MIEQIEYRGWKNNLLLSNGDVEVIVTAPRAPNMNGYVAWCTSLGGWDKILAA